MLPQKRRIPDNAFMSQPIGKLAPPSCLRVFVVDDERALVDLVGTYLTREGFAVFLAHDGQQAIERVRQVDPDVKVLDLGLSLIDGVEVWPRGWHSATSLCSPRSAKRSTNLSASRSGRTTTRPSRSAPQATGPDPRDAAPSPRCRDLAALAGKGPECSGR